MTNTSLRDCAIKPPAAEAECLSAARLKPRAACVAEAARFCSSRPDPLPHKGLAQLPSRYPQPYPQEGWITVRGQRGCGTGSGAINCALSLRTLPTAFDTGCMLSMASGPGARSWTSRSGAVSRFSHGP